jgi:hypothetical protein
MNILSEVYKIIRDSVAPSSILVKKGLNTMKTLKRMVAPLLKHLNIVFYQPLD